MSTGTWSNCSTQCGDGTQQMTVSYCDQGIQVDQSVAKKCRGSVCSLWKVW